MHLLILFLRFSKSSREFVVEFLCELDMEEVKLDEADWYFCLRRDGYDFGGIPIKERLEERKRLDKEKGHNIPIAQLQQVSPEELKKITKATPVKK